MKLIALSLLFLGAVVAQAQDLKAAAAQTAAEMNKATRTEDLGYFEKVTVPGYYQVLTNGKHRSRGGGPREFQEGFRSGRSQNL